ncbi:hypothetical protein BDZ94DRAFT_1260505 [Collybia nuda]|uniref:F-box domain-containing protein n=1 Tax=Collybia nuda TaxID=64659 RepID=A0A9P6CHV3_9AGAR|nr:hypothetical protein BDZ94DRAFT_1260505 [Collybia nuda]
MSCSPFAHKLTTNYVPTIDEIAQISRLLVEPLDQLRRLDAEISRLQQSIDELTAKRQRLDEFITPHQALLSPIRRIPQEVLQEIFLRCLPTNHNSVMSCREAPLLLGRVCSLWRSLSMTMPALWSSIYISVPQPTTAAWEGVNIAVLTQAVTEWLSRSGTLPLSITLYHTTARTEEQPLVQYMVSLCSRWKHVDLSLSTFTYPLITSLTKEDVPLLESCSFRTPTLGLSATYDISFKNPPEVLQAHCLRRLLIPSFMVPLNIPNWSALAEVLVVQGSFVTLHGLRIDAALSVLRHCQSLVVCTLALTEANISVNELPVVTVPNLKTLALHGGHGMGSFLERLRLPALCNLELKVNSVSIETNPVPLYSFLSRVVALESFTLTFAYQTRETLTALIARLPDIAQLFINIRGGWSSPERDKALFDDEVLALLEARKDNPVLPRLKAIECRPSSVSPDALFSFIESRTTYSSRFGVNRLDRVSFELPEKGKDIFPALSEVVAEGTEVIITYEEKPPAPRWIFNPRGNLDRSVPRLSRASQLRV